MRKANNLILQKFKNRFNLRNFSKIKNIIATFFVLIVTMTAISAQKFSPKPTFLSGQKELNVSFDFEDITFDGKSQEAYIDDKLNEKTEEEIETWLKEWNNEFPERFKTALIECVNKEFKGKTIISENSNAEYTIYIKCIDIDPGKFAGPFSKPAKIVSQINIVNSEGEVVSTTKKEKTYCDNDFAKMATEMRRIEIAFDDLGENIGEALYKFIK